MTTEKERVHRERERERERGPQDVFSKYPTWRPGLTDALTTTLSEPLCLCVEK